jgi:hypothetical protein
MLAEGLPHIRGPPLYRAAPVIFGSGHFATDTYAARKTISTDCLGPTTGLLLHPQLSQFGHRLRIQ